MLRYWMPIIFVYILAGMFFAVAVPMGILRRNKTYSGRDLIATIFLLLLFWPFILLISIARRMAKSC
jgi:hypothetical protein